ncbi:MAG: 30S ribosomal protein S20 [Anaerolineae bacterium]
MANHKSAIKRIRQTIKRQAHNRIYRGRARTFVKKARLALAKGTAQNAAEAVRLAVQDLDRAASRGVIHPNNAARRKSRLMKQLAALQAKK